MSGKTSVTVVICTRDRAESLEETLRDLARCFTDRVCANVILIDNASMDNTCEVAADFKSAIPIRYVREERIGKGVALNRALDEADLGDIIAVLDDDMSVREDWLQGILAICERWPDCDVFCGRLHIRWPQGDRPGWAEQPCIRWAYSVLDCGGRDVAILTDAIPFPPGNCFWFRRRVLDRGIRFPEIWLTEPGFTLELADAGCTGVAGPEAVACHRIQRSYLSKEHLRARIIMQGRDMAGLQLRFNRHSPRFSRLGKQPALFFVFVVARLLRWSLAYVRTWFLPDRDRRIARQLLALLGLSTNLEALRRVPFRIAAVVRREHEKDSRGADR